MVKGKLDRRDGREEFTVLADEVLPLEQVRERYAKRLSLTVTPQNLKEGELDRIHMLINQNPGSCKVFVTLKVDGGQELLLRSKKMQVHPAPGLLKELRSILGRENVWIEG